MKRIIFCGKLGLEGLELGKIKGLIRASATTPVWMESFLSTKGIEPISAYHLANNHPDYEDSIDSLTEIFQSIRDGADGDYVFQDDFGKYRASELASAFSIALNIPVFTVSYGETSSISQSSIYIDTGVKYHLLKIIRMIHEGEIKLPEGHEKIKVVIHPHIDDDGVVWYVATANKLNEKGHFLEGGFECPERARTYAMVHMLDVAYVATQSS